MQKNGFTLIELIVVISVISFLSAIILFSVIQYINSGKDASIRANLSILIPTGETYYNTTSQEGIGYTGFCDTNVVGSVVTQLPLPSSASDCPANTRGLCCNVKPDGNAWAACIREFSDDTKAFCVDNRGIKKEISVSDCTTIVYQCP